MNPIQSLPTPPQGIAPPCRTAELATALGMAYWCRDAAHPRPPGSAVACGLLGELCIEEGWPRFLEAVHPEDRDRLTAAAQQAARDGLPFVQSFRGAREPTRFLRIAALARREGEQLALREGMLVDETAHVVAQSRLAFITETTPALLWVMEPSGFCSFFSRSWYEYTGQAPEEALGLGWLQKIHPHDLALAAECADRAVRMRAPFRIEHRLRHRSGGWRWVLCVGNPRFDAQGRFLGHSGAVTDIHDRRTGEQSPGGPS